MKLRTALFVSILAIAGAISIRELRATPQQVLPAPCVITVPQDWGQFRGMSKSGLVFEDRDGTLRLIDEVPCSFDTRQFGVPRVAVEVRRK
jgi:hypothetical protein